MGYIKNKQSVWTGFCRTSRNSLSTKQKPAGYSWQENNHQQLRQSINQNGYWKSCNSQLNNLCCTQVQSTSTFRSTITHKTFKINNKLNCKSKCLIHLMECVLCNKQYTSKSETIFNLRLNNHWKDVNKRNSLQADQHFWLPGHNFNKHAKFTLIEQLNDTNIDKELLKHKKEVRTSGLKN